MLITRDQFLSSFVRRYRDVPIPSGGTVRLQNLNELERVRIESKRLNAKDDKARRKALREDPCLWIIATVVDEQGQRLFTEEDIPALQQVDSADTRAIYVAAQEHCGTGEAKSTEDNEKNCGGTNDACSSSE